MHENGLDLIDHATQRTSNAWSTCVEHLTTYFTNTDGVPDFSGARFDGFGNNPWNRIVADDLLAVSMLSVQVPGHAALRFLERDAGAISALLERIPDDLDLCDAEPGAIAEGSPSYDLWRVLHTGGKRRNRYGTGEVTTSKLLARKRPRLLPVYDGVVAGQFGLDNADEHWERARQWLASEPARVQTLRALRSASGVPCAVSLLRVLDVVLWMQGRQKADSRKQQEAQSY